ncbi:MAG: UDP-N-acetylmuramate--L-alanine ligase [Planctomycetes bacterium]|nr:UDP-N-acetylmuramate--L-alanine ligase [Planctomycetota bacterium]
MASGSRSKKLGFSGEKWHFIGILGSGMRSLARYAVQSGASVSGSDLQRCPAMKELQELGVSISLEQDGRGLDAGVDLVIASQAIPEDNRELRRARQLGLEVVCYPEMLGRLMEHKVGIGVAGTHGKSTTASIISFTLRQGGLDPSFLIGADVPQLGGGAQCGSGRHVVVEACEYKRSFLQLSPKIAVITNVDEDHLDYYYDIWDIRQAFSDFAEGVGEDGLLVANADDENTRMIVETAGAPTVTFGIEDKDADYRAERLWRAKVHSNFDLVYHGERIGRFSTRLYGTHSILNILAGIAVCHQAGMEFEDIQRAIENFAGPARRMQLLGTPWGVSVITDYAHHPNEIRASIEAAHQQFPKRRIFVLFQPHQHSRTRKMLSELADSFRTAWVTYVSQIYAARDSQEERRSVDGMDLVRQMNHIGLLGHYVPDFEELEDLIVGDVIMDDVVLVMGAGDIWKVANDIIPMIEDKGRRQIAA